MKEKSSELLIRILTILFRFIAGGIFIFSGFAKGIDPWGTFYQIKDYLAVWGWNIPDSLILSGAFILIITEFITGVSVFFGCFRRGGPILMTLIMTFMLPLSLWIALKNPVEDCGCFGEALILSNTATFWKNVVLTSMSLWLLIFNTKIKSLIRPYIQWIEIVVSFSLIMFIAYIGYTYQPLIDFRPYKINTALVNFNNSNDGEEPEFVFIYEKNGIRKSFSINDSLPDDEEWKFVERKEISPNKNSNTEKREDTTDENKNFRIWDESGNDDITEIVADPVGKRMYIMMPEMGKVSVATTWKINNLYKWCQHNDIDVAAIVSGSENEIEEWRDISLPEYPIYLADDTSIKEIVRGNPALVYTEDGIIKWKSSLKALPIEMFSTDNSSTGPSNLSDNNSNLLQNLVITYILFSLVMIFLSYSPWFLRLHFSQKNINHDGKVHPEE